MLEIERHKSLMARVVAGEGKISLPDYSQIRERIFQQEQSLIRLLNFDFQRKGEQMVNRLLHIYDDLSP